MIVCLIALFAGGIVGFGVNSFIYEKRLRHEMETFSDNISKQHGFYSLLIRWVKLLIAGKSVGEYMHEKGYRTVAVYGMKEIGVLLIDELEKNDVTVAYGIDQAADSIYLPKKVIRPDEPMEPVDVVVVTAIHYYQDIRNAMETKFDCPIVSLIDMLYEIK